VEGGAERAYREGGGEVAGGGREEEGEGESIFNDDDEDDLQCGCGVKLRRKAALLPRMLRREAAAKNCGVRMRRTTARITAEFSDAAQRDGYQ
jgi:hypothetical protein